MGIFLLLLILAGFACGGFALAILRNLGHWNRTYLKLSKRYGGEQANGGVTFGYLLSNPSLMFDYGRTFCVLKSRKSMKFPAGCQTELSMTWPDKRIRLEVSSLPIRSRAWVPGGMKPFGLADPKFENHFHFASNQPQLAKKLLSGNVQWKLEQLRRLTGSEQLLVVMSRGNLLIAKPGFIKDEQPLDDFIRFGLELFDQMMLTYAVGIEFLNSGEASIVNDAKCPICSEVIKHEMVMCRRCKTPHCLDCWQYNGQCATFACRETEYVKTGSRTTHNA